ncbi:hypothetical protein Taro_012098 [Colocasia esculenta]|uniref:DUF8040 domain-containing protein n=1 Tax=Colocasia esculenta TaxID=4460 RepID=A0A843UBZ4_COLES|nr:hypothetical protein [Colocasia esculenta]
MQEQLLMFLYTIVHNVRNGVMCVNYLHSGETVSRCFNPVLKALRQLHNDYIQPPNTAILDKIRSRYIYWSWFKVKVNIIYNFQVISFFFSHELKKIFSCRCWLFYKAMFYMSIYRGHTPTNKKELFILRHSSLRKTVERAFGLLKRHFRIIDETPYFPFPTQVEIVLVQKKPE